MYSGINYSSQGYQAMSKLTFNRSTDLYNMALGGLIALFSEQEAGKLGRKVSSQNVFLGKWLKRVKKQRCYPKSLSADIDSLLYIYLVEGRTGNLASLFKQIFSEYQLINSLPKQCTQTDRVRFDNAMRCLAKQEWFISLPIKQSHDAETPYRPTRNKEIYTTSWYWNGAFNEQHKLSKPFSIFVVCASQENDTDPQDADLQDDVYEFQEVIDCLFEQGFILVKGLSSHDNDGNCYYQYQLMPDNIYCGDLAIPSKYKC